MPKYIDADALFEHLAEAIEAWDEMDKDRYPVSFGMSVAFKNIFEYAKEHSTAEVVEVRHGEWLKTESYPHRVYCSCCLKNYVTNEEIIQGRSWQSSVYCTEAEYCPHCGAKMDGKKDGDI